ncbi:hypothetical protein [Pontibacter sp. Tf4]|uniref:hypothetical protein n=1 Tax=Pontibacter sp. Tf4 TaxID=2761620 RepID=UPI001C8A215C|nr:hypothetical protein [Pontibacter sp. Tf4]
MQLAHAETGQLISALSKEAAIKVATSQVADPVKVDKEDYLTEIGSHHEYRERLLPAWAVTFSQPDNCTVYVSAELGAFQAIRHNQWRVLKFCGCCIPWIMKAATTLAMFS